MMVRLALLCALWLAVGAATPPRTLRGTAVVTIDVRADGAGAVVALDRPVTRFTFEADTVVRSDSFRLVTPGLTLDGRTVSAAAPFRRFEFAIGPTTKEHDAKYPAYVQLGTGGVLYAPALVADPAAWRTVMHLHTARGQVRAPSRGLVSNGMVFIGPRRLLARGSAIDVVADPAAPQWLVDEARGDLMAAVKAYTRTMGVRPRRTPLLVLKHIPGGRSFNVGDATPGAVVTIRFHGDAWMKRDPLAAARIRSFIFHEAFHFWNAGIAEPADDTPTWLHEGGADYAALLAEDQGAGGDAARKALSEALNRCRTAVQGAGDKALSRMGFLTSAIRYPCGMVLQWSIDLAVRRVRPGATILDSWAATVRKARGRPRHAYSLRDFYDAAGIADPAAVAPVALLVDRDGPARWLLLADGLNALGAEVDQQVTPNGRRTALFFHLLRQSCTKLAPEEGFGYFIVKNQVRLQAPKGCGILGGDPPLKSVEGGDPFDVGAETYAAVQRKCAAGREVLLETRDGRTLAAPCAKPLADAPQDYTVRRWVPAVRPSPPAATGGSRRP